jgi:hypothetical protein
MKKIRNKIGGDSRTSRFGGSYLQRICYLHTQGFHIFLIYILISKRRHEILKKKLLIKIKDLKDRFGVKVY